MKQILSALITLVVTFLTKLRSDAGWRSRRLAPLVVTALGLASDFLSPWFDILSKLLPAAIIIMIAGLWFWLRAYRQGEVAPRSASIALYGLVSTGILAPIFSLNVLAGGDKGLMATVFPFAEDAQIVVAERLDRIELALNVLNGKMDVQTVAIENVKQTMERSLAVEVLNMAMERRNGSRQGQVEALQSLLGHGYDFIESDFSGISFRGGQFDHGIFSGGDKILADFRQASFTYANLEGSNLAFSNLRETDFSKANLDMVRAEFSDARNADFSEADVRNANFYGADLRNADLSKAELSSTSLAYADLRGANLRQANLAGAYLTGALLDENTDLTGATFDNTNMLSVIAERDYFSHRQITGFCRHSVFDTRHFLRIIEDRSGPTFAGGRKYENLVESWPMHETVYPQNLFADLRDKSFPPCDTENSAASGFSARYPLNLKIYIPQNILNVGNRRSEVKRRFEERFRKRESISKLIPALTGDGDYRLEWLREMAGVSSEPDDTLSWHDDNLLLMMLASGTYQEGEVVWKRAAHRRFMLEQAMRKKSREGSDSWDTFFPVNSEFRDLPYETENIFRDWTLARAERADQTFTLKIRMVIRSLDNGRKALLWSGEIPEERQSWPSAVGSELEKLGRNTSMAIVAAKGLSALSVNTVVMIFDRPVKEIGFTLPQDFDFKTASSGTEMILVLSRAERRKKNLYLYVEPTQMRFISLDRQVVLSTTPEFFPDVY